MRSARQVNSLAYKLTKAKQIPKTSTYKLTNPQTHEHKKSQTQKLINSRNHNLINSKTHQFINSRTYQLISQQTQKLKNSSTQKPKKTSTQNLKLLSFILQLRSDFRSVLAKIWVKKQANSHYFLPFTPCVLSVLKNKTCVLHHLAFLDWSPPRIFSSPITPFLPLKTHFLTTISHLSVMCFIARKGVVYTICGGYLCFSPRILHQNTLRLAPK